MIIPSTTLSRIDQYGHIVSFNRAAEHIFGYPLEEIIGKHIGTLMPASRKPIDLASAGNPIHVHEMEGLRQDGRLFPMELTLASFLFAWHVTLRNENGLKS